VLNPPIVAGIDDDDGGPLVQRKDDTHDVVVERLATYDEKTAPLVGYYAGTGLLLKLDGLKSIDAVTADLLGGLSARAGSASR
jgi:adenylate kinase